MTCVQSHGLHSGDVISVAGRRFRVSEEVSATEFNVVGATEDIVGHPVQLVSRWSEEKLPKEERRYVS